MKTTSAAIEPVKNSSVVMTTRVMRRTRRRHSVDICTEATMAVVQIHAAGDR